uniref:Uncharacterized protein n=1 Tax=Timema cristinae TaxID=61476 RepID=A0A7R9CQB6_TIMCR|nr:unnamed protein product [Timema cristinae]
MESKGVKNRGRPLSDDTNFHYAPCPAQRRVRHSAVIRNSHWCPWMTSHATNHAVYGAHLNPVWHLAVHGVNCVHEAKHACSDLPTFLRLADITANVQYKLQHWQLDIFIFKMSASLKRKGKNAIMPKPFPFSQKKKLQFESHSLRQEQKAP